MEDYAILDGCIFTKKVKHQIDKSFSFVKFGNARIAQLGNNSNLLS